MKAAAPSRVPNVPNPASSSVASRAGRNALIVGGAFIASRALGLIREIVLGYRFGTSSEYDAYVSAFRIPDLLFLIVMSGAFGAAFIPIFGGLLAEGDDRRAWRLASAVITRAAIATVGLALVTFVFAEPIMRYLVAPDLPDDVQPLAVRTMRILLLSPIFLGLGIAAKGILEAQEQFTLPALSPVLYNGGDRARPRLFLARSTAWSGLPSESWLARCCMSASNCLVCARPGCGSHQSSMETSKDWPKSDASCCRASSDWPRFRSISSRSPIWPAAPAKAGCRRSTTPGR